MSKDKKIFDLQERLIDFAVKIIRIAESLPKTRVGNHIAGQLIRCGTSPAPNYGEAQSAESRSDFIPQNENMSQRVTRDNGLVNNNCSS
jgi:four helix bundle protein